MRLRRGQESQEAEGIDISPLIDIVFILLIFFMVTTTFVKDLEIPLNRPGASTATVASTKSIRVFVDKGQSIYLDGEPVRSWVLQNRLRDKLKSTSKKSVLVVSDGEVPANKLVEVVDQCRLAGATRVGVATEREGV